MIVDRRLPNPLSKEEIDVWMRANIIYEYEINYGLWRACVALLVSMGYLTEQQAEGAMDEFDDMHMHDKEDDMHDEEPVYAEGSPEFELRPPSAE